MLENRKVPRDKRGWGVLFGIFFMVWAVLVASQNAFITSFDRHFNQMIYTKNPGIISFAKIATKLGNTSTIVVLTIIVFIILLVFKRKDLAYFLAGVMICADGYNWIIKHLVKRTRPTVTHLVAVDGYSFPSGHSVGSAAFFGCLIIICLVLFRSRILKFLVSLFLCLFPIMIGYTRILLHVHFPSDVFGGWIEGIAFVLLGYSFLYHFVYESEVNNQAIKK
ncbi:MAG: phosphatase PAP2 family protein [Lactobacillus sp.]|nr:phosphatase PAP2 family protein [Lactobacillus sp.]